MELQTRIVRLSIPALTTFIFEQDAIMRFKVTKGFPNDVQLIKASITPDTCNVELIVKGSFSDGGKDGDFFGVVCLRDDDATITP
jgi:hypothetical protein